MIALAVAWVFVGFIAGAGVATILFVASLSFKRERRYEQAMAPRDRPLPDLTLADRRELRLVRR